MRFSTLAAAIIVALALILVPEVAGISVTMSTDDVSLTDEYSLADETSLQSDVTLIDGVAVQSTMASGSKQNTISTEVGSSGYSAGAAVSTYGEFSATSMTVASKEGAVVSSSLVSIGCATAEVSGVSGADAAGQQVAVYNGAMDSVQMEGLSAGRDGTVGKFGFAVTNMAKAPASSSIRNLASGSTSAILASGTHPEIVQNPAGNPSA
jgi:hypothetical protein